MSMDGKHSQPCIKCGTKTYRQGRVCRYCTRSNDTRARLPNPKLLPEDYLLDCARELARRHEERAGALAKLGIGRAA